MFPDLLFFLVFIYVLGEEISEFPPIAEVEYEQGTILGLRREAGGDRRPYYTFKGIPYALPPVGDLRLKPPIGDVKWDGVRDGSWDPPVCTQFIGSEFVGEEDCLYLNVYTPKPDHAGYPVIVFIHGGDFIDGSTLEYPPLPLLTRDIVLVVLQYRLGMLGFLSADDIELPGNLGLRDQTKALLWVQNNIKKFGGDPHKVTLFGTGSGAASVHYQILTPYAKGLFSRAIMQSGSSLCPSMLRKHYPFSIMELLSIFNCPSSEMALPSSPHSSLVLDCLQNMPLKELASLYRDYFEWHMLPLLTVPRVDGDYLPDHPVVLLKEGRYNKVDIIAGFNQHDGTMLSANLYHYPYLMKLFKNKFLRVGALLMGFDEEEKAAQLAGMAYHKLIGDKSINEPEGAEALTKLFTDRLFSVPIYDMLSLHAETSPHNSIFYYRLVHRGKFSFCNYFSIPHGSNWVCNGDDISYLFDYEGSFSDDLHLQDIIVTLWTNFAAYGTPTPDESLGFLWNSYTSESHQFLELQPSPKMSLDNDTKSVHFWHSLDTAMNKYLFPNGTGLGILNDELLEEEEIDYDAQHPVYSTDLEDKSKFEEAYQRSIVVPNGNLNKPIDQTSPASILPRSDASFDIVIEDLVAASGMWSDTVYPNPDNHKKVLSETMDVVEEIYEDPLQESPFQAFIHTSDNAQYACNSAMEDNSGLEESEDHHCIKRSVDCDDGKDYKFSKGPSDEKSVQISEDGFCKKKLKLKTLEKDPKLQTEDKVSGLQRDVKASKLLTDEKAPNLQTVEMAAELHTNKEAPKLPIAEKDPVLQIDENTPKLPIAQKASKLQTDEKATKLQTDEKATKLQTDEKASDLLIDENLKLWTGDRKPGIDASTRKPLEKSADMNTLDGGSFRKCTGDNCEIEPQTLNNKIPDYYTINKESKKQFQVADKEKHTSDTNLDPVGVKSSAEDVNVAFSTTNVNVEIFENDEVDLYTVISAGLMKAQVLLKGAGEGDVENVLSYVDKDNLHEIIATYGDYVLQYLKDIKVSPEQIQQIKKEQSKVLVEQSTVLVQDEKEIESLLLTPEVTPDKLYPNKKKINYGKINFSFKREVEVPILVSSEGEGKM